MDYSFKPESATEHEKQVRARVLRNTDNQITGWFFIRYEKYTYKANCQISGYRMLQGIRVGNNVTGKEYAISERVGEKYLDDLVIPQQTEQNTVMLDPIPYVPQNNLPKKRYTQSKRRGRPPINKVVDGQVETIPTTFLKTKIDM